MIVIYTQDKTLTRKNADDAKDIFVFRLWGETWKRGISNSKQSPVGTAYRKNGGPLVQVVTKEKAEWIERKESVL